MKYLGIDYGTKKVGIAISDDGASFAFPQAIVATPKALEAIQKLVAEKNIEGIVIGESLATNMMVNAIRPAAEAFTQELRKKISVSIHTIGEGFSSVEAHRYQTKAGARDDSAAAIILQRFLDKKKIIE